MKPLLKTGALAVALGVATWLLGPLLLPANLPADFPKLPDLRKVNPGLRAALQSADHEARRRPGSAEVMGKLGMSYHANLFLEQAERAYRIAARWPPNAYQWVNGKAFLKRKTETERNRLGYCRRPCGSSPTTSPPCSNWLTGLSRGTGWTKLNAITTGPRQCPAAVPLCKLFSDSAALRRAARSGTR